MISHAGSALFSQPGDWASPIDGPILLSGTYGELRGNHYHGGLDIKANIAGDQPVRAAASGYIREILVRGGSYGNALILQHADGFRSLYGHLDHFREDIDALVKATQYQEESFEISVTPDSTMFRVEKGDMIGIMGNTGYSFGRHLHFEVQHDNGLTYNPQRAIPTLQDGRAPQIRNIRINYHDMHGREYREKTIPIRMVSPGHYTAGRLTLNALKYSLGIDVVDLHESTYNRNGIYSLQMIRNDRLIYETSLDSLTPEDRKYYTQHIDYISPEDSGAIYHNLIHPTNPVSEALFRSATQGPPLLRAYPFREDHFIIKAADFQGNTSQVEFSVTRQEDLTIDYTHIYNYLIPTDRKSKIDLEHYSVIFPEKAFITPHRAYIFEEEDVRDSTPLPVIHLGKNEYPLYENARLILKSNMGQEEKQKWTLAYCRAGKNSAVSTQRTRDGFTANIRSLTSYCLLRDTLPPVIRFQPVHKNKWHFTVQDDLHPFSALKFTGKVDDQWVLVQADDKNDRLIFTDFDIAGAGRHTFTLIVEDGCGNQAEFREAFVR